MMDKNNSAIPTNSTMSPGISIPIVDSDKNGSFDLQITYVKLDEPQSNNLNISNSHGHWLKIEVMPKMSE